MGAAVKICHIIIGLNVGGAEHMLRRLVEQQKCSNLSLKHIIISLTDIGPVGKLLQNAGVEVYAIGVNHSIFSFFRLWTLFKMIRLIRPDIIQTWMYHADLFGGLIGRLAGCKNIIWGIRGTDVTIGSSSFTRKIQWLCAKLSKWVPKVIVCAAHVSSNTHIKLGYDADKMIVISNGFNDQGTNASSEQVIIALRSKYGIQPDELVIGAVGRFNAAKDYENFVSAAELVGRKIPNARFLIVGRGCDDKNNELMKWIYATDFSERFILVGERPDISLYIAMMDVFCVSSKTEGFPNVLGEAMMAAKLCVTTDVGDAAFLLGECGLVIPKQNSLALANAVMKLLALLDDERASLQTKARNRILTEFSMTKISERFEYLYRQIMNKDVISPQMNTVKIL